MQHAQRLTLEEMEEFVSSSSSLSFTGADRKEIYGLVEGSLQARQYQQLSKKDKGVVRRYLAKVSGRSMAQITRLISRYRQRGTVQPAAPSRRHRFARRYTAEDIALLAAADAAHEGLSGPALRRILEREYTVYGHHEYQRLASISASHIYNLRRTAAYRRHHLHHGKTRPRAVAIGERRRPDPRGQPGYLRVDTVHQGDTDTRKGLYHINAVDAVTQWQVVGCCETISEAHLIPVVEAILHQFPFRIRGFHSDNGSEFLNRRVAKLLNKLLVGEFTKSRAYRTTDNALVEGKNGAVVRKHIGHEPIAAEHAAEFQRFYTACFNPLFELSPSLRVRHPGAARQWQTTAPLSAPRLPYALREAALTRRLGAAFEAGHQRRAARTTSAKDERHGVRPDNAASQAQAAGAVPVAVVKTCTTRRGLAAPDSALMGGGGGSSTHLCNLGDTLLCFPLPLNPPPPRIPQKGNPHPALSLARPTSFQDHLWIGKCSAARVGFIVNKSRKKPQQQRGRAVGKRRGPQFGVRRSVSRHGRGSRTDGMLIRSAGLGSAHREP